LPVESTLQVVPSPNSVTVRFAEDAPPGRNSSTTPVSCSESPSDGLAPAPVNTKMPSEVAGSASGIGSCSQKPSDATAVTTPGRVTVLPARGERCAAPWTSRMRTAPAQGLNGGEVLRGPGARATKSARLLSVSAQPFAVRWAELALFSTGAGVPSAQFAVP
jgi:hypothetical protein